MTNLLDPLIADKSVATQGFFDQGFNGSKVLMNDRVYRTGDTIEHQLGIKLAAITAGSLTFEDDKGARYTRNF